MSETISSGITITIPTLGEQNWSESIKSSCFTPISSHDHTGSGNGVQLGSNALQSNSIVEAKIANNAVTAGKIASNAVTTAKILDANVTVDKLATDSVSTAKIVNNAVTADKILADAVTTAKILDANVLNAKCNFTFSNWVPTLTASGSMTVASEAIDHARYVQLGKLIIFTIEANFTLGGTPSTDVNFTLPVTAASRQMNMSASVIDGGISIGGFAFTGSGLGFTAAVVRRYDTANWSTGTLRYIRVAGTYEAA